MMICPTVSPQKKDLKETEESFISFIEFDQIVAFILENVYVINDTPYIHHVTDGHTTNIRSTS